MAKSPGNPPSSQALTPAETDWAGCSRSDLVLSQLLPPRAAPPGWGRVGVCCAALRVPPSAQRGLSSLSLLSASTLQLSPPPSQGGLLLTGGSDSSLHLATSSPCL